MQGKAFGVACDDCRFVTYTFSGIWSRIQKLQATPFKYCPLCAKPGHQLDSMDSVRLYEDAYAFGTTDVVMYKKIHDMYWDYWRETKRANPLTKPKPLVEWFKQTMQEAMNV